MKLRTAATWIVLVAAASSGCSSTGKPNMASGESGSSGASGETVAAADGQAPDLDPRVCELVLPTGSRIAHRVCMKQSEWDRIRGNSQDATIEHQRRAVQQGNPTGN